MGKDSKKKLVRDHHKVSSKKAGKNSESAESKEKPIKPENSIKKEKPEKKPKKSSEIPETSQQTKGKKAKTISNSHEEEENPVEILKKPGQKHPEPSLDDPTRAFYETLYEQNPESLMAQKYCLEYGLLPEETATSLLFRLKHKNK